MPSLYALNLFDLVDNDLYRQYSRRSASAVGKHGGRVLALGRLESVQQGQPGVQPRRAMVLVEWPSREAFEAFLEDPEHADLHPLREHGTRNYLWWTYERLEDLRPLLAGSSKPDNG
ncbi:MAG: DUF1330 domain-containing protein, partial [Actinomycetota bacterium]|nr:DUF1330 domain-containing protein [Actinomycetota bacterium]